MKSFFKEGMLIVVIKDKWILEQSSTGSSSTICGSTSRHLCEGFIHPSYWIILVGFLDHCCWTFELSSLNFGLNIGEEDSRKGRSDQGAVWPHRQHRPGNCQVTGFETASWPLVNDQDVWQLSKEVVAELKEVFMLFDKDEDQKTCKMRKNTLLTVKTFNGIRT